MHKDKPNQSIKKPKFVLTDEAKFYLATKDMTGEDEDGLFFVASLFLPVKKAAIVLEPHTEIATFDDAESAMIYHQTVSKMAQIHEQMDGFGIYAEVVKKFNEHQK